MERATSFRSWLTAWTVPSPVRLYLAPFGDLYDAQREGASGGTAINLNRDPSRRRSQWATGLCRYSVVFDPSLLSYQV